MTIEDNFVGDYAAGDRLSATGGMLGAILLGTLVAGAMDITAAIVTWMFRGVPAMRILQSVAGGLLGRDTFAGGPSTAVLGLLLHFMIMSVIVSVYVAASSRLAVLTRHAIACGIAYGIAVYIVMTFVVVPLSAAGGARPSLPLILEGGIVHILCVGVPIALITRRFTSMLS